MKTEVNIHFKSSGIINRLFGNIGSVMRMENELLNHLELIESHKSQAVVLKMLLGKLVCKLIIKKKAKNI